MTRKPARPEPKKTEAIEIRVSAEQKAEFMAACEAKGRPASEVIRDAMHRYSRGAQTEKRPMLIPAAAMAFAIVTPFAIVTGGALIDPSHGAALADDSLTTEIGFSLTEAGQTPTDMAFSTVRSEGGETARVVISGVPGGDVPGAVDAFAIDMRFTPGEGEDEVYYTLHIQLLDAQGDAIGEDYSPSVITRIGETASIRLGSEDGRQTALTLRPVRED